MMEPRQNRSEIESMLQFFRNYQKAFLAVVTFFIVVSFVFFGTSGAITQRSRGGAVEEIAEGSTFDPKLRGLISLLKNGAEEGGAQINVLNDSVIHTDFILSGLGEMVAERHVDLLFDQLAQRWRQAKEYRPYIHPFFPSIQSRDIWSKYAPKVIEALDQLKAAPQEFSKKELPILFKLYQAQADFPPHLLHQFLYYAQEQRKDIQSDPALPYANMALFNFHSIEDWFGSHFVEKMAQFILNGASIAVEQGIAPTQEEAKRELLANVGKGIKPFLKGKLLTAAELQGHFSAQIQALGLTESSAIDLWRSVSAVRRLFKKAGDSVAFDPSALSLFSERSQQICRYTPPKELQFTTFFEMLQFQCYLEIVAADGDLLGLPSSIRSVAQIAEEYPELVYRSVPVLIAMITKGEVESRVGLKQTWDWECNRVNFRHLEGVFPILAGKEEDRFAVLDGLDSETRFQIDAYARSQIVKEQPERIEALLREKEKREQTLKIRPLEHGNPLSGSLFLSLIEKNDPKLARHTIDEETFYSIEVLDWQSLEHKGWELISFSEGSRDGTIDALLDRQLKMAHAYGGYDRPFEEVRQDVACSVYRDLVESIAAEAEKEGEKLVEIDRYSRYRFDRHLKELLQLAKRDPAGFEKRRGEGVWPLVSTIEKVTKGETALLAPLEYSSVNGGEFYQFLGEEAGQIDEMRASAVRSDLEKRAKKALCIQMLDRT